MVVFFYEKFYESVALKHMRLNIETILKRIASTVNQEATAPTSGGSEFNLWIEYINRSIQEWSEANDWEDLRKVFFPTVSGTGSATVSLPPDYKKLAGPVKVHGTATEEYDEYPEVLNEETGLYNETQKYVRIRGNVSDGRNLIFHPGSISSGASVEIPYFSMPTAVSAYGDIPSVSDSQFLVDRTIAYVLEARSDARFQQMEAKARERLTNMIENANLNKFNSYNGPSRIPAATERKLGFRLGRD